MEQAAQHASGVRVAELVASLSFATDLGRGLPMEHSIRRARLSLRLADRIGAAKDDRIATYYTGLLDGVYCHADANEQAMWFGDDIGVKADTYEADTESLRGGSCSCCAGWAPASPASPACGGSRSSHFAAGPK